MSQILTAIRMHKPVLFPIPDKLRALKSTVVTSNRKKLKVIIMKTFLNMVAWWVALSHVSAKVLD